MVNFYIRQNGTLQQSIYKTKKDLLQLITKIQHTNLSNSEPTNSSSIYTRRQIVPLLWQIDVL
jgi:hypothetical protein